MHALEMQTVCQILVEKACANHVTLKLPQALQYTVMEQLVLLTLTVCLELASIQSVLTAALLMDLFAMEELVFLTMTALLVPV